MLVLECFHSFFRNYKPLDPCKGLEIWCWDVGVVTGWDVFKQKLNHALKISALYGTCYTSTKVFKNVLLNKIQIRMDLGRVKSSAM